MKLYALSDVHLDHRPNREAWSTLPSQPDDALVLVGDVAESMETLRWGLELARTRFREVVWVPGNHELWTVKRHGESLRGVARYDALVAMCRAMGVTTPEDPYRVWPEVRVATAEGERSVVVAPLFLHYDFSFGDVAPAGAPPPPAPSIDADLAHAARVRAWAVEGGIVASDDALLHTEPHLSSAAWCRDRIAQTIPRLEHAARDHALVLLNHYPLREELLLLGPYARYAPWCGTRATVDWHRRFAATVVVSGHIHIRTTKIIDGVRFEQVPLGYPRDWDRTRGLAAYLRRIL